MTARDLELAEAVEAIRNELLNAAARGAGNDVTFQVGPIQMEFTVELRRDVRARGGIKAYVLSGEVDAGRSRTRTHRVSFTLEPRRADGDPLLVAADGEGGTAGLTTAGPL